MGEGTNFMFHSSPIPHLTSPILGEETKQNLFPFSPPILGGVRGGKKLETGNQMLETGGIVMIIFFLIFSSL